MFFCQRPWKLLLLRITILSWVVSVYGSFIYSSLSKVCQDPLTPPCRFLISNYSSFPLLFSEALPICLHISWTKISVRCSSWGLSCAEQDGSAIECLQFIVLWGTFVLKKWGVSWKQLAIKQEAYYSRVQSVMHIPCRRAKYICIVVLLMQL